MGQLRGLKGRILELTHDEPRGRKPNPNAKKGKNNKEKSVDLFNVMENWVVRGEIVVVEIKERLEIFEQKMEVVDDLGERMGNQADE